MSAASSRVRMVIAERVDDVSNRLRTLQNHILTLQQSLGEDAKTIRLEGTSCTLDRHVRKQLAKVKMAVGLCDNVVRAFSEPFPGEAEE